ncbi:MAG: RNA polymerase sigma factor [Deltaproteobacteria bacterium]|nr:RNA polymerase sigma factor [Deltaproteobacteria bacterium]
MTGVSDIELVKMAASGDREAFGLFAERHYGLIYRTAFKWSGVKADAEDITQESLMKLARSIDTFRSESDVKTWLYRVTVNAAKDFHRRNSVKRKYEEAYVSESLGASAADEGIPERSEEKDALMAAIGRLSDKLKDALLLVVSEGLSHAEAAKVLGCAVTTVAWRVFEAKRRLSEMLEKGAGA